MTPSEPNPRPLARRLLWFAALWLGGVGTVTGAFLGALVLTILRNGFTLQGISAYTFNIILGVAILVAMILNVYVARLRGAGGGE